MPQSSGTPRCESISPTRFLAKDAPPSIVLFGTADRLLEHGREWAGRCKELGVRADLILADDQPHGFFNRPPWLQVSTREVDRFPSMPG